MPNGLQGDESRGCKSSQKWSLQVEACIYWYLREIEYVIAKVAGSITGGLEDDFPRHRQVYFR